MLSICCGDSAVSSDFISLPVSIVRSVYRADAQFDVRALFSVSAEGYRFDMCRNIRTLHNFEPAATSDEVHAAALQYVRKIAGTTKPSQVNAEAFDAAVEEIAHTTQHLLDALVTNAPPKNREEEAEKRRARFAARTG